MKEIDLAMLKVRACRDALSSAVAAIETSSDKVTNRYDTDATPLEGLCEPTTIVPEVSPSKKNRKKGEDKEIVSVYPSISDYVQWAQHIVKVLALDLTRIQRSIQNVEQNILRAGMGLPAEPEKTHTVALPRLDQRQVDDLVCLALGQWTPFEE